MSHVTVCQAKCVFAFCKFAHTCTLAPEITIFRSFALVIFPKIPEVFGKGSSFSSDKYFQGVLNIPFQVRKILLSLGKDIADSGDADQVSEVPITLLGDTRCGGGGVTYMVVTSVGGEVTHQWVGD